MVYTFRNLLGLLELRNIVHLISLLMFLLLPKDQTFIFYLLESAILLRTSTREKKCLTAKLLQQGYRYHKLRKTFSNFYRRHYELISKFNVGLKTLLHDSLSEPEFYGDLVYKSKKI